MAPRSMMGQSSELELCDTGWDGFSGGYDRVRSGGTSQEMAGEDPGVI